MDPKAVRGITPRSLACLAGAIFCISLAPGKYARTVSGSLKARNAIERWEDIRTDTKDRLKYYFDKLDPDERTFVMKSAKAFMAQTQDPAIVPPSRYLSLTEPSSPRRERRVLSLKPGQIQGGDYLLTEKPKTPSILPPDDPYLFGLYITSEARAERTNDT